MRRILHISTGLQIGGAETLLYEFVNLIKDKGYESIVISLQSGGGYADRLRKSGIQVIELNAKANSLNISAILSTRKIIKDLKPQIIHAWMYHANLFALVVIMITDISMLKNLIWGIFSARIDMSSYGRSTGMIMKLGAYFSSIPSAIVYNAKRAASDHREDGYDSKKELLINNCVDIDRFKPDKINREKIRKELNLTNTTCVVIVAARNHPQKDWSTVLKGIQAIDDVVTIAVGEGTELIPSQEGLLTLGRRDDMPALYAASDIFLLPSAFGEGTSVAMCEAMSTELPVIVTDVGDNAELGAQAGFVIPIGEPDEIRKKILMLSKDKQLRSKLGAKGREIIVNSYARDNSFNNLIKLYAHIINNERV